MGSGLRNCHSNSKYIWPHGQKDIYDAVINNSEELTHIYDIYKQKLTSELAKLKLIKKVDYP